ncbi:MAG: M20/M25/M40 family metallo-hydrolase [Actinomycetota bacterium]
MEILETLKELVSIPSPPGQEERIQQYLAQRLIELEFDLQFQEVFPKRENIIARRGKGELLLCTHADTFPAYTHTHPYLPRIQGGNLIGRGAVDAKGQIAALLEAVKLSKGDCAIALVVDEENEGKGSEILEVEAKAAVVLEPTNLDIAIAEAGAIEVDIEVEGKGVHGAMPERGENAILKALEIYERIKNLPFSRQRHALFPKSWVNLGLIEGGCDVGVVPEKCKIRLDVAILPGVDVEEAIKQMKGLIEGEGASLKILDISPPFSISESEKIARTLSKAFKEVTQREPRLCGMRSWTDAQNLMAKGIPTAIFGAGNLANAHSSHESISLKDLETMAKILARLIDLWT